MKDFPAASVVIHDPFWSPRLQVNAARSIFHQWDQLEKSGCIDNFRIVAGEKDGFREGWVFADSDAYKWLDAASRIYAAAPDPALKKLMDDLLSLLARAQMDDGYIYTFNQFHFPGQRWVNLQIEHEFYCLGHLLEAGVSHSQATGESAALEIATKAASLLVRDFLNAPPECTDGHEEVEIGLLRLGLATGNSDYIELARHFIEARGRIPFYPLLYRRETASHQARRANVSRSRAAYAADHPDYAVSKIPPDNPSINPPFSRLRRKINAYTGLYTQQHAPVRRQTVPVGHAVRYGYLQTATTLLARLRPDPSLLPALEQSWERLLTRRMYVTGGLGALPGNEGFGNDFELDPQYAYNETCAALASLFWNWEMALLTGRPRHSDLFEWQLYNAAAPGMGIGGDAFFYNNPLESRGGITRRAWYSVPCCPSNLSRTWASLGKYIYSTDGRDLWLHQYIGSHAQLEPFPALEVESSLPFEGSASIRFDGNANEPFTLYIRLPSWCPPGGLAVCLNGELLQIPEGIFFPHPQEPAAQGYDPRLSAFLPISRRWQAGDQISLTFDLPVLLRRAVPQVKNHAGKVALTRGPLVYCLESVDNPGVDIFNTLLQPSSLQAGPEDTDLGRITLLRGKSEAGETLTFIPYHLWGNRGPSRMTVWVRALTGA